MEQNSNAVVENSQNSINSSSIGTVTSTVTLLRRHQYFHISNKGCVAASNATSGPAFSKYCYLRSPEVADAF